MNTSSRKPAAPAKPSKSSKASKPSKAPTRQKAPAPVVDDANNRRLRELIEAHGMTQAEALKVFNRGMGLRPYKPDAMKAFLCSPDSTRFRKLSDELLAHAEREFAKLERSD